MEIHYFQRYHGKENMHTANAMLLLSRLYKYSADEFFAFLEDCVLPSIGDAKIKFSLQEKSIKSVPDASITQASFKVVVETKLSGHFNMDQLGGHLESFHDEKYQVLLTLDPNPMNKSDSQKFEDSLSQYNENKEMNIFHKHLTFEDLIKSVRKVVDERNYEMLDIVDEYEDYCNNANLISDSWKKMRVQLASKTIKKSKELRMYYYNANRGSITQEYIGLYDRKSVRAIGRITDVVVAEIENGTIIYKPEQSKLTEDMRVRIAEAIKDGKIQGYDLSVAHRYFFVDEFYETDFKKESSRAPMGARVIDLAETLGVEKLPTDVNEIAELLKEKTWN